MEMLEHGDITKSFYHNKSFILDAYTKGSLYVLRHRESDEMFKSEIRGEPYFYSSAISYYVPAAFIIRDDEFQVEIIWVAERIRRMGFGTKLVKLSCSIKAGHKLEGSEKFWESLKF